MGLRNVTWLPAGSEQTLQPEPICNERSVIMEDKERQSAFLSALSTEHFALQAALSSNVSESAARSSIYLMSLSSSLVAMGFAFQTREFFAPFTATVLPALFLLGLFTAIRLVDLNGLYLQDRTSMARIRGYYRTLTPEAADYFAPAPAHWSKESF